MNTKKLKKLIQDGKYVNAYRTQEEIVNSIKQYKGIKPEIEQYTYENGHQADLVTLVGTIPICYRKSYYHIPIAVYLPINFPDSPPICYVRPTPEMQIKESKYVDNQGKVLVPYLESWTKNSVLQTLLQVMGIVFSETPPVYQKTKPTATTAASASSTSNWKSPTTTTPAPYPSTYGYPYNNPYAAMSTPGAYPGGHYNGNQQPVAGTPGVYPTSVSNNSISSIETSSTSPTDLTQKHIRASLISAVGDQIKRRLNERVEQYNSEMEVLTKTKEELNFGKRELDTIIQKMETDTVTLEETKKDLQQRIQQLDEALSKVNQEDNKLNVDDAYGPSEPLYKQLFNTFDEENSTSDVIYYLGEALKKGTIDLDTFLKNVRELSRKQFMLRALMQKCREKAGLPY